MFRGSMSPDPSSRAVAKGHCSLTDQETPFSKILGTALIFIWEINMTRLFPTF